MKPTPHPKNYDWDPRSPEVQADQIAAYDAMRARCPVARSRAGYVALLKHADVLQALNDPDTFSAVVSRYPAVPNGMDAPDHTDFRRVIDPYFTPERMTAFAPECTRIVARQLAALPASGPVEGMEDLAWPFAVHVQCSFMGWPTSLHDYLRSWTRRNHAATMALDNDAAVAVAAEFDQLVRAQLAERRAAGAAAPDDVTTRLLHERVRGRPLHESEIVSIARNWTMGELSTIAASVGILLRFLATHPDIQAQLRAAPALLPAAIDEILRLHGPLVLNRRRVTRATTIGGKTLQAGDRVTLVWPSANRDEDVFEDARHFRLDRDPAPNLLYGAGVHVCPGAPLARLELRILMGHVLASTRLIALVPGAAPQPASYPASGWSQLPLQLARP